MSPALSPGSAAARELPSQLLIPNPTCTLPPIRLSRRCRSPTLSQVGQLKSASPLVAPGCSASSCATTVSQARGGLRLPGRASGRGQTGFSCWRDLFHPRLVPCQGPTPADLGRQWGMIPLPCRPPAGAKPCHWAAGKAWAPGEQIGSWESAPPSPRSPGWAVAQSPGPGSRGPVGLWHTQRPFLYIPR